MTWLNQPVSPDDVVDTVARTLLGDRPLPVDLNALAPSLQVNAIEYADIPFAGYLLRDRPKGWTVVVSSEMSPARQRFTVAHEFAHALLELAKGRPLREGRTLERTCDALAAAILMPRQPFMALLGPDPGLKDIERAGNACGVSLIAAVRRAAVLNQGAMCELSGGRIRYVVGTSNSKRLPHPLDTAVAELAGAGGSAPLHADCRWSRVEWSTVSGTRTLVWFPVAPLPPGGATSNLGASP